MLKSQNEGGGFGHTAAMNMGLEWGGFGFAGKTEKENRAILKKAEEYFDKIGQEIKRLTKASDAQVVEFLDSRQGRHLADKVIGRSGSMSSLPATFKKEYWDWWAKEQGIQLSDADSVASLRARHAVHFGAGSATQLADAPVQLASGDLSNGKLREAAQALNAVKNEIRGVFTSGQKVDPRQYSRAIDAIDQALASLGEAGSAISKLLV